MRAMRYLSAIPMLALAFGLCSCQAIGYLGYLLAPEPPTKWQEPEYAGLEGKNVAIVVYADEGMLFEHPLVRWEIAGSIGAELSRNVKDIKVLDPRTVTRYQDEDIDWDARPKSELGKALGVEYVLYVALSRFSMNEPGSAYLYRADIAADTALYRTAGSGAQARVWQANNLAVAYPDAPMPADSDATVRTVAIGRLADLVAKKFYRHKVPKEP